MRVLSESEVRDWFVRWPGKEIDVIKCDERGPFFAHPEANCIDLEYPPKLERLPFFVRYIATLGYEDWDFYGAMLWFTEWGVWNPRDEGIGYRVVEALHIATGQSKSFEAAPGHLFRADELNEATGMLLQPIVFGWDAVFVPMWSYGGCSQFFLHVSHDSYVTVVTRTKEFHDRVFGLLDELKLNPKPGSKLSVGRFCRIP